MSTQTVYDRKATACNGCKHLWYSAPDGHNAGKGFEKWNKPPHIRCLFFKADIPCVVEKQRGCTGTVSNKVIRYMIPEGCPTVMKMAQAELF